MKIEYRDGLLYTSIKISCNGKTIEVKDVVIDTGAAFCILEPSSIEELGITLTKDDEIETFYGVNGIFSYIKRTADNIILDVLIKTNAVINLSCMDIKFDNKIATV